MPAYREHAADSVLNLVLSLINDLSQIRWL
jgi:hypothetical protein